MAISPEHCPETSAADPIDLAELHRLGDTKPGDTSRNFVHDVIELFLNLGPQIFATANEAFTAADPQSVARAAHKLKSQAAYFGAGRMVKVCKQIEDRGYRDDLNACEPLLRELERELGRVISALEPHRYRNPG